MSVTLRRHAVLQVIAVQTQGALDTQGRPSFNTAYNLNARVIREDSTIRAASGESIKTFVTCYISGDQSPMPKNDDLITFVDGVVGIVVERIDGKTLGDVLDHVQLKLREK